MSNTKDISHYNIIGTISDNTNFSAWIASNNQKAHNNMVLINRFAQCAENKQIFKDFFSHFSANKKVNDMENFFATKDSFYVVFKYNKGIPLTEKLDKSKSNLNYEQRCKLLSNILMKIDSMNALPLPALVCLSDINNIIVNDEGKAELIYNFENIKTYENAKPQNLFYNLSKIIELVLNDEINDRYNHNIKLIAEQCVSQLYNSIPQLIVELEKAEKKPNNRNFITHIKEYIAQNKKKARLIAIVGGIVVASLVICIGVNLFMSFKKHKVSYDEAFSFGTITYETDTSVNKSIEPIEPLPIETQPNSNLNYAITADSGISSEDYIVQYGDTIASICSEKYSSQNFIQSIEAFNNISDSQLVAGLIIKLPDETSIISYVSK